MLFDSGDTEGAIQENDAILLEDPNHVDALYNLGAIYANNKQPALAVRYWQQAVSIDAMSDSGRSAQRGLDVLGGKQTAIPNVVTSLEQPQ